jgi:DNA adenine methylase
VQRIRDSIRVVVLDRGLPESPTRIRPFLKWAGGKRQLLPELRRFVPRRFGAYHEPFLGSGAMFFDLWHRGALAEIPCRLTDSNRDLVGCYRALAEDVQDVVRELRALATDHSSRGADAYYRIRNEEFNPRRRELSWRDVGIAYPPKLAAMFIYLNRTGYNGLFRLNSRGDFNVPAGRYARPRICDESTLEAAAAVLRCPSVELRHDSFESVATTAGPGDFVYLDPPYAPLSATANFTSYTSEDFDEDAQRRLQAIVIALAARGCSVTVSNSTAPLIADLYESTEAREVGLRTVRVAARRAINSKAGSRNGVEEFIISNVRPA